MKSRKKIISIATVVVILFILGYSFFNARLLIEGPKIIVKSPENGLTFDTPFIEIEGEAHNTAFISMNGNPIYINENGEFKEKLLLPKGTSIIKFDARDRFERTTETTLWYTYDGKHLELITPEILPEETASSTTETSSSSSSVE